LNNLAAVYWDADRLPEAIPLFEQVRDARMKLHGPDDRNTLATLSNLASAYVRNGQKLEGIRLLEQVREARVRVQGPEHPDTLSTVNNLGTAYWEVKQLDKSIPLFEQLERSFRKIMGERHPHTLGAMANLGVNYRDAGRYAEAIPLLEQVHRDGGGDPSLAWVGYELLLAYSRAGKGPEASALARELLAVARKTLPAGSPRLATALAKYGAALIELQAWADAEPVLRDCLSIREKIQPDNWRTFNTRSLLGAALLGQKRYPEAEPLLLQGYEGMKQWRPAPGQPTDGGPDPERLIESLERLVRLCEAMSRPDEAAKWRAERANYPNLAPPPRSKK
jgi:tetratricopeptide (TPR) repeat protein